MKAKNGISLIVLVITIIVIIILAGAVILSLSQNNPIAQANQAKMDSDKSEVQSAVTLFLAKVMASIQGPVAVSGTDLGATTGAATVVHSDGTTALTADELTSSGITSAVIKDNLGITLPSYPGYAWNINADGNVTLVTAP